MDVTTHSSQSTDQLDRTSSTNLIHRWFLILILAAGCSVRLWHIDWDLPHIYEEAYPFGIAWRFWNWGNPGFDFNPHVFNYAALSFYVQFAVQLAHYGIGHLTGAYPTIEAYRLAYQTDSTIFLVMARSISVVFDLGTILCTYLIARRLTSPAIGLASCALVAINPLHVRESHLVNVDTPLTFFVMLSLYIIICKLYFTPRTRWYVLAGIFAGLAAATKYTGALLIPFMIFVHCMRSYSLREALRSVRNLRLVGSVALSVSVFLLLNPHILLNYAEFRERFSFIYFNVIEYGHLGVVSSESTIGFYLANTLPVYLGLPFALLTGASILYLLIRRTRELLFIIIFPVVYLAITATWAYRADRYMLPIMPLLIIIGCIGVAALWEFLARHIGVISHPNKTLIRALRILVVLMTGCVVLIPMVTGVYKYQRTHEKPDTRTAAQEWIASNLPKGSTIATAYWGSDFSDNRMVILSLPYHPVITEAVAPFYNLEWYSDLDYFIFSSFDYGRYHLEPAKYAPFLQFYHSMKSRWKPIQNFAPANDQNGPEIWIFRPPAVPREGQFSDSLFQNLKIIDDSTIVIQFLERLGFLLFSRSHFEKSIQVLEAATTLDPMNTRTLRELAWTLFKVGRYDEVLSLANRSLIVTPRQPEVLSLRGSALLRLNRWTEAEESLIRALEMNDRLEIAYLDLELLYRKQNDHGKLINVLSRYLNILPRGSDNARRIEARLHELDSLR